MHGARNEDMKKEHNKNYYTFWWGIEDLMDVWKNISIQIHGLYLCKII